MMLQNGDLDGEVCNTILLIDIEARVLAVADVLESMASYRPYRPALGMDKALEELEKNSGLLYDAEAVTALVGLVREKHYVLP